MDIMGYLDINFFLQYVYVLFLILYYLIYFFCLMVIFKFSSVVICNKNKYLQGRDKVCVNIFVDISYCNGLLQLLIYLLLIIQRVWFLIFMGVFYYDNCSIIDFLILLVL